MSALLQGTSTIPSVFHSLRFQKATFLRNADRPAEVRVGSSQLGSQEQILQATGNSVLISVTTGGIACITSHQSSSSETDIAAEQAELLQKVGKSGRGLLLRITLMTAVSSAAIPTSDTAGQGTNGGAPLPVDAEPESVVQASPGEAKPFGLWSAQGGAAGADLLRGILLVSFRIPVQWD